MRTVLLCFFLFAQAGFCYSPDQILALQKVQTQLGVIKQLRNEGILNVQNAEKTDLIVSSYYAQAEKIVGHRVTADEIDQLVKEGVPPATKEEGFSTFLVIAVVFAGIVLTIAVIGLIGYYLWPLLITIPVGVYEASAYALTSLFMAAGYLWKPFSFWVITIQPLWFVVPGALAFAACVILSWNLHVKDYQGESGYAGPGFFSFPVVIAGICCIVWGSVAVSYHSLFPLAGIPYFLSFISVMALESFLGFSVITMPGCVAMGWSKDDIVPRTTSASAIILAFYVVTEVMGKTLHPAVALFSTGGLFMGAFVYYLGLLVMSSKYYSDGSNYGFMQVLTVISGVAAFFFGSTFGIGILLGVGGTFFSLYLLEKYYEIPWDGVGWFWSLLGVAVAVYFLVGFAEMHPQYFLWTTPYLK